jgi:hypothetical protein
LYLLAGLAGFAALVWASYALVVTLRARRRRRFLRDATADEIAHDCAQSVVYMGWAERSAGARLLDSERRWTERELLDALEALFEDVTRDEREHGYGTNYFCFYDGGFAETCEALRDRLGIPQPWAKPRAA